MSFRLLNTDGKPVKQRSRAASRMIDGKQCYHYELFFRHAGKQCRRREWLRDDAAAVLYIDEQCHVKAENGILWNDALRLFLASNKGAVDYNNEREYAVKILVDYVGDISVDATTLSQFSSFLRHLKKQKKSNSRSQLAARTVNKYRAYLLAIAHWCREQGIIQLIPWEYAPKLPEKDSKTRVPFSINELPPYYAALPDRLKPPFMFLALTGSRISVACNLRKGDIKGGVAKIKLKGGRTADLILSEKMLAAIAAGNGMASNAEFVFLTDNGAAWKAKTMSRAFTQAWAKAGLPHRVPHELRHMMGTQAAKKDFTPDKIQAALRHSHRATAEQYIHQDAEMASEVHRAVGADVATILQQTVLQCPKNSEMLPHAANEAECLDFQI